MSRVPAQTFRTSPQRRPSNENQLLAAYSEGPGFVREVNSSGLEHGDVRHSTSATLRTVTTSYRHAPTNCTSVCSSNKQVP